MGDKTIGVVRSNILTTDNDWTGLEFTIWVPITNLDRVHHEEYINGQPVGATFHFIPRREPAAAQNFNQITANDGDHDTHSRQKREDLGDPDTADKGTTTQTQEMSNPQDGLQVAAGTQEDSVLVYPKTIKLIDQDRLKDQFQFKTIYAKPQAIAARDDGHNTNNLRTSSSKAAIPQGLLNPKPNKQLKIADDVDQEYGTTDGLQKRAHFADQITADRGKATQDSTRPPKIQHVKGVSLQKTQQSYELAIDICSLAQNMTNELEILHPLSDFLCIYRVPDQLRYLNENAYKPHALSIGPFHHGEAKLATTEYVKKRYLQHFLNRNNVTMEQLFEETLKVESKLRDCYAEIVELASQDFIKMMVLDGCFMVEYLLRRYFRDWESNDPVFNKQRMNNTIRFDLLLLENQIPFFYLNKLFSMSNNEKIRRGSISMVKLVRRFLEESTGWDWLAKDFNEDQEIEIQHILHLLMICLLPKEPQKGKALKIRASPSIMALHSAGVKFRSSSNRHFLDIQFKDGILDIPTWKISDQTEVLFRNLLAFELCNPPQHYLSDYVALMDMLINVELDVELLVQNGIIESVLQDNQSVTELVNNLGKNNVIYNQDFYFSDLVDELKSYCEIPWHKWKATLKQEYFKNPWTIISVIAAAFLLLLTILQSVCSVLQVLLS